MKNRILVPLDGTKESEGVLPEVQRLAQPDDEVHLLHVIPELHAPIGPPSTGGEQLTEKTGVYLEGVRARWRPEQPGLDLVRVGDPAEGIVAEALEKNIHLIAMATRGRKGASRLLLGSVAAEVVRRSQLPVLLSHPEQARSSRPIQRILVTLEGAEGPKDLLDTVKVLAGASKAEIILFHAIPPVTDPAPQWAPSFQISPSSSPAHRLQELADVLEGEGFLARPVVTTGAPAKEILEQAARLDVDLIALATQARSGLDRFLQGSVAEDVLRQAGVPVLLQKPLVVHKSATSGNPHA